MHTTEFEGHEYLEIQLPRQDTCMLRDKWACHTDQASIIIENRKCKASILEFSLKVTHITLRVSLKGK